MQAAKTLWVPWHEEGARPAVLEEELSQRLLHRIGLEDVLTTWMSDTTLRVPLALGLEHRTQASPEFSGGSGPSSFVRPFRLEVGHGPQKLTVSRVHAHAHHLQVAEVGLEPRRCWPLGFWGPGTRSQSVLGLKVCLRRQLSVGRPLTINSKCQNDEP